MTQLERLIACVVRSVEDAPRQMETMGRIITITVMVDGKNEPIGWQVNQSSVEGMTIKTGDSNS